MKNFIIVFLSTILVNISTYGIGLFVKDGESGGHLKNSPDPYNACHNKDFVQMHINNARNDAIRKAIDFCHSEIKLMSEFEDSIRCLHFGMSINVKTRAVFICD